MSDEKTPDDERMFLDSLDLVDGRVVLFLSDGKINMTVYPREPGDPKHATLFLTQTEALKLASALSDQAAKLAAAPRARHDAPSGQA